MQPIAALLMLVLLSAPAATLAQQQQATTQPAAHPQTIRRDASASTAANITRPSATRVALSLAAVLGLIVALAVVARRLAPRGGRFAGVGQGGGAIHVLARTAISPKQKIILLQVGRRILVVADSAGQNLSTLCEIADFDEAAALIGQLQAEKGGHSFTAALNDAMERFRTSQQQNEAPPKRSRRPELDSMRQELEGLAERVRGMAR